MDASICYAAYSLPEETLSLESFFSRLSGEAPERVPPPETIDALRDVFGFDSVRIGNRREEVEVFEELLASYFATSGNRPEDVDYLIYAHGNSVSVGDPWSAHDTECVNVPYALHEHLRLRAQLFNVEQECSSTLASLKVADALIRSGSAQRVLLLSSNFFPNLAQRLMADMILVSDGQAILEVSAVGTGLRIVNSAAATDGRICFVRDFDDPVTMEKVVDVGCGLMRGLVRESGLRLSDISLIIPQNISKLVWQFYCHKLDFPIERVFLKNCGGVGHTGDVDIPRNISDVLSGELLKPGQFAILYGLGTGTSWNAVLVTSTAASMSRQRVLP